RADRVSTVALRVGALTPTFAPTLAPPCAPMPIRCASALFVAAMDSPAAATIAMTRFLHMHCLLFLASSGRTYGRSGSLPLLRCFLSVPFSSPRILFGLLCEAHGALRVGIPPSFAA